MTAPDECAETVYNRNGSWGNRARPCGKPVKENGMCGVHAGAEKRRKTNAERRTAEWKAREERFARSRAVADLLARHYDIERPGVELSGQITLSYKAAVALLGALGVEAAS